MIFATKYGMIMGVRKGGGAYRTFAHPLEIGTKKRKFLENLKLAA